LPLVSANGRMGCGTGCFQRDQLATNTGKFELWLCCPNLISLSCRFS
jgi:hypothetical protein